MIIITGAAGFIGSCLVTFLNKKGVRNLILVDDFSKITKNENFKDKDYIQLIERNLFLEWFQINSEEVSFVFHLGARTDTTEQDESVFEQLNLNYSMNIWDICTDAEIPLVYASSAATYGNGEYGYSDEKSIKDLKPMNPYGWSKHNFDLWALQQSKTPPDWTGLKFFNVYGPNEYHKGRMASVVMHAYNQIKSSGKVELFRSHRDDFEDGEQLRDFIYVLDVLKVCYHFYLTDNPSGLYNVGTGKGATFIDLVRPIFKGLNVPENIEFIDIPEDIRDTYQYFTEATTAKLRKIGFKDSFTTVDEGVAEYVQQFLNEHKYY
ncbi:MAG: ADP-glyceromanno-heptose 6-epimerase [Chitinophagales bacterium]|nr:ADP-glyceromanno-heptose 6-epimerase [Chitinophagales bacterium]